MPALSGQRLTKSLIVKAPPGAIIWDSELRGLGLRVTSAGTRSFVIQYRLGSGGQQRRMVIGGFPKLTVEQARSVARIHLAEVEKGADPAEIARRHVPHRPWPIVRSTT